MWKTTKITGKEGAKAKLEAIRNAECDPYGATNRIGTSRHPSTGTEIVDGIERSHKRSNSDAAPPPKGIRGLLKSLNAKPAY